MKEKELPSGCTLEIDDASNKIYLKFNGRYVITQETGQKKWFRGILESDQQRARSWAWRFAEGFHDGYEVARS